MVTQVRGLGPNPADAPAGQAPKPEAPARQGSATGLLPWAAVVIAITWNLWELRATLLPAQFLNDSSVHEQMVRFAAARIAAGHDPLTSWFPYVGLGSPHFLHYQSAPAMLTGLAGLVMGRTRRSGGRCTCCGACGRWPSTPRPASSA